MTTARTIMFVAVCAIVAAPERVAAGPVGSAFTYSGQLKQSGVPMNGTAGFEFSLWDDPASVAPASQVGATLVFDGQGGHPAAVDMVNGLFSVQLDFGMDAFDGNARWLEVTVSYPPGASPVTLIPRQAITPTPYALALPALRTQPNATSPNLIGGSSGNSVTAGVHGATISGGGPGNQVTDEWGTVGGGASNRAGDGAGTTADAGYATVGGGVGNVASGFRSTVAGGRNNTASGINSIVAGGANNTASNSNSTVSGGVNNDASGNRATIAGGIANVASGDMSTVGGGDHNTTDGFLTSIPGGSYNQASGAYSLAAGHRAQASHLGSFVWSDSTASDPDFFTSTGDNQFLISAAGGVGINTNSPGAALHIGGAAGVDGLMFPDGTLQTTASVGGGDSLWSAVSSDIYYDTGKVGIGTQSPISPLHVKAETFRTNAIFAQAIGNEGIGVRAWAGGTDGRALHAFADTTSGVNYAVSGHTRSTEGYAGYFTGGRNYFEGFVGIGEPNPTAKLHIGGTVGVDGIRFPDGTLQKTAAIGGGGSSLWSEFDGDIFYNAGRVGIGTAAPGSSLHIVGPNDPIKGPILFMEADAADQAESGRIRFGEGTGNFRGAYLHYDGFANKLHLGMHSAANSDPADDVNAITIWRFNGAVGIGMDSPAWPLHVTGDSFFEDRVGIGGLSTGAQLHVEGHTRVEGSIGIRTTPRSGVMLDMNGDSPWGLRSETTFTGGVAIKGTVSAGSGSGVGVVGNAASPDGIGVQGRHTATTGTAAGVYGVTDADVDFAAGVKGEATATTTVSITTGVTGISHAYSGIGVYGKATYTGNSGWPTRGGLFESDAPSGYGVHGIASGANAFAGFFAGRGYFSGDVGIGTQNPVAKLDVAGTARVDVLQIDGGADLSENFAVDGGAEPGMVVVINPDRPGALRVSSHGYDRRVAGILSGAGGIRTGMLMGQAGSVADGDHPVALTGRVYCRCDASSGAIEPGDMLTTSDTKGHAMKVTDYARAQGAIIGKAMTSLERGEKGLVLVLVNLQ